MTWSIAALKWETPSEDVIEVHWLYGEEKYGSVSLEAPGEDRVELSAVTEELAIQWAKDALGEEEVEAIEEPESDPVVEAGLPWAPPVEPIEEGEA